MAGQTVMSQKSKNSHTVLDVRTLTPGVYLLETTESGLQHQQKFIKE
jgi:hypothetical protein